MKNNHILSLLLKKHSLSFFIESISFYAKYPNHFFRFFRFFSPFLFFVSTCFQKNTHHFYSPDSFLYFFNQKSGFREIFFPFPEILEG